MTVTGGERLGNIQFKTRKTSWTAGRGPCQLTDLRVVERMRRGRTPLELRVQLGLDAGVGEERLDPLGEFGRRVDL